MIAMRFLFFIQTEIASYVHGTRSLLDVDMHGMEALCIRDETEFLNQGLVSSAQQGDSKHCTVLRCRYRTSDKRRTKLEFLSFYAEGRTNRNSTRVQFLFLSLY
jgi:hypothetical protein